MKLKNLLIATVGALSLMAGTGAAVAADMGKTAGHFLVRGRVIGAIPDDKATISRIGGTTDIGDSWVPEVDGTYFLTDNIGLELIAGTTKHSVKATGTALGRVDLGSVWLLPPTLTLQYHFAPKEAFSPYVGAGVNYTIFYSAKAPGGLISSVKYKDNGAFALQAGADFRIAENTYLNIDVKKIWLSTDVSINNGFVTADVDINPTVVGVGIGWMF